LLPLRDAAKSLSQLEQCLQGINQQQNGIVDRLVIRNRRTVNVSHGAARLMAAGLEIAQKTFLEDGSVNTQAVTRSIPGPALYHRVLGYQNGVAHKIIVPLQYLLKGWGDANRDHQCYVHMISENVPQYSSSDDLVGLNFRDSGNYYYVGITGRNWLVRLNEHVREMANGSQRHFYRAWREHYGAPGVLFTSYLDDINQTYEAAMNWEEAKVDEIASDQYGLNMIPGGFKGLRLLHESRITKGINISLEERDRAVTEYCRQHPRKGLPNPFISELWKDDDFYAKVIEAKVKALSFDQVKKIRLLDNQGVSVSAIVREVGALNEQQVKGVLFGKTYRRVR
jgi:hypothetical protein